MESQTKKCKKIVYKNATHDNSPSVLIGLIVDENFYFLTFKTAKKEYVINKESIISIESTDEDFREDSQ